jgi:hypothetical protein
MRSIICAALIALATTAAAAAETDTFSANFWLPYCKGWVAAKGGDGGGVTVSSGICMGLVMGVFYTISDRICAPNAVPNVQVAAVVIRYVEARPRRWHEPFWQLSFEAITDAWPCKGG